MDLWYPVWYLNGIPLGVLLVGTSHWNGVNASDVQKLVEIGSYIPVHVVGRSQAGIYLQVGT